MSSVFASGYFVASSNLLFKTHSNLDGPIPEVVLPQKLADLISRLSAEGQFPEPWTNFHAMHSELAALSKWVQHKDKEAEETGHEWDLVRLTDAIFTTIYTDDDGSQTNIEACPNCTIVLAWLGIQRLDGRGDPNKIVIKGPEESAEAVS